MSEGRIRLYVMAAAVLAFFVSYTFALNATVNNIDDQRVNCESGNRSRVSELGQRNDLIKNARARAEDPDTREEGQAALARALHRRQQLIDSVTNPEQPGSVIRNCVAAYPKPFPFNYLEGDTP